jgi:hypothetical protein
MSLTYQSYIVSLNTEETEHTNADWNQYFDTELGIPTNSKKHTLFRKVRQTPINKIFQKKPEPIKEPIETEEDIETGNSKKRPTIILKNNCFINLYHFAVTFVFYISHLAVMVIL